MDAAASFVVERNARFVEQWQRHDCHWYVAKLELSSATAAEDEDCQSRLGRSWVSGNVFCGTVIDIPCFVLASF